MSDAADIVAIDVFESARAAGEPITVALVKRRVAELLAHAPECACGRCEAAATARIGHIWQVASAWERSMAATRRRAWRWALIAIQRDQVAGRSHAPTPRGPQ
jgi:hypothetical protein